MLKVKKSCDNKTWYIVDINAAFLRKTGEMREPSVKNYGSYGEISYWDSEQEAQQFLDEWLPKGKWFYWLGSENRYRPTTEFNNYKDKFEINWLTEEEVKEAAQKGDKEALDCSIEHWKQIVVAGYDEYVRARDKGKAAIDEGFCALCQKFQSAWTLTPFSCYDCFLTKANKMCGSSKSIYQLVRRAQYTKDKPEFEKSSVDMLNLLVKIRNKKFGNPYLGDKEMKELTVREISEKLGYEVKVVKEQEKPKHQFKAGDVALSEGGDAEPRIIFNNHSNNLRSVHGQTGDKTRTLGQKEFEFWNYKYIGRLSDFINEKTIKAFQRNGKVL